MSPEGKSYYSDDRRRAGEKFMNAEQEQSKEKNSLKNKLVMAKVAIGNAVHNTGKAIHNTMHAIGEKMARPARYVKDRVSSWCERRFNKKSESKEQSEATTDDKPEVKLPPEVEDFFRRYARGEADLDEAKDIAKSMEQANKAKEAAQETKSGAEPEDNPEAKPEAASTEESDADAKKEPFMAFNADGTVTRYPSREAYEQAKNEADKGDKTVEAESSKEQEDAPLSPEERKAGMEQLRGAHEMIMAAVTSYDVSSASRVISAYNQMVTGYASKGLDVDQLRLSAEDLQRIMYNAMIKEMSYARQNANRQPETAANTAAPSQNSEFKPIADGAPDVWGNAGASAPEATEAAAPDNGEKQQAVPEVQINNLDSINQAIEAGSITEDQFNNIIDAYNRLLIAEATLGKNVAHRMLTQAQINGMAERLRQNIARNQANQPRSAESSVGNDAETQEFAATKPATETEAARTTQTAEQPRKYEVPDLEPVELHLEPEGEEPVAAAEGQPRHGRYEQADEAADREAAYDELDQKMAREQAVFDSAVDSIDRFQQGINDWRFQQGVESGHAVSNEDMQQQFGDLYGLLDIRTDENGNQLPVQLTPEGRKMAFQMAAAEYDKSHDHAANGKHAAEAEQAQSLDDLKQHVEAFNQFNAARQAKNEKPVSFYSYLVMNK